MTLHKLFEKKFFLYEFKSITLKNDALLLYAYINSRHGTARKILSLSMINSTARFWHVWFTYVTCDDIAQYSCCRVDIVTVSHFVSKSALVTMK